MKKRLICLLAVLILMAAGCFQNSSAAIMEFLHEQSPETYPEFSSEDITKVYYYYDEWAEMESTDPERIEEIYTDFCKIKVTGKYTGDLQATDTHSILAFTLKDGQEAAIHFETGRLRLNQTEYELEDTREYLSAIRSWELDEGYD